MSFLVSRHDDDSAAFSWGGRPSRPLQNFQDNMVHLNDFRHACLYRSSFLEFCRQRLAATKCPVLGGAFKVQRFQRFSVLIFPEKLLFEEHIFQMGRNHQLVLCW